MAGKRKDFWVLGQQAEHRDGEQAKSCCKNRSLSFNMHADGPKVLDPNDFLGFEVSPGQNEPKLNQQHKEGCSSCRMMPLGDLVTSSALTGRIRGV